MKTQRILWLLTSLEQIITKFYFTFEAKSYYVALSGQELAVYKCDEHGLLIALQMYMQWGGCELV